MSEKKVKAERLSPTEEKIFKVETVTKYYLQSLRELDVEAFVISTIVGDVILTSVSGEMSLIASILDDVVEHDEHLKELFLSVKLRDYLANQKKVVLQ